MQSDEHEKCRGPRGDPRALRLGRQTRGPPCQARAAEVQRHDRRDGLQSEDTWMELHVLHRHGWSIAALAREFGLNWRTARRYATGGEPPRYRPRVRPAELTAAGLAHVERRLAACPDLRATVLHRELREGYGYTGSYTSLRRRVVELRPTETSEPEIRFETGPGIQTQGDWTDCGTWPLGAATATLYAFVAILGSSRMPAVRFGTDKTRPTTLQAIVRCVDD